MSYNNTIAQIRELLERHLDSSEIARRLHLDVNYVLEVIAFLST